MGLQLRQLISCIEKFSPPRLALPGDFVGIQVGPCDRMAQEKYVIEKCALAVDVTPQVILRAASEGANLLTAYYGLMSVPVDSLTDELLDKVRLLVENRIVVYVVHTSWLSAECGVNDTLADILGLDIAEAFNVDLEGKRIPVGRICTLGERYSGEGDRGSHTIQLLNFVTHISEKLGSSEVIYVGSSHARVARIAMVAGEYGKTDLLRLARTRGVDTYITGSVSRRVAVLSTELGLNYVCIDHHVVESLGMRRLMQLLGIEVPEVGFTFVETQYPWKKYAPAKSQVK